MLTHGHWRQNPKPVSSGVIEPLQFQLLGEEAHYMPGIETLANHQNEPATMCSMPNVFYNGMQVSAAATDREERNAFPDRCKKK